MEKFFLSSFLLRSTLAVFTFELLPFISFAQLTVTQGGTATAMASAIVGPGVIVSNATITCPTISYGTFSGNTNLGLSNGILLTTGDINQVPGPGSNGFFGIPNPSYDNGAMGSDPDLTAIEQNATFNTCKLEFDVIPICDTLQINYVFASEEYPEYVCSSFNDVFGFFITGPNPAGGNYNAQNIAVIPGTNIAVAINSINPGVAGANGTPGGCTSLAYNSLYVDNASGPNIAFDGFTDPLIASVPVTSCQSYHLKLVIADAGDGAYDSGVFLEQSGLTCPGTSVSITAINDTAVEGCVNGTIQITRGGDLTSSMTVNLSFSGSATAGTDYTLGNSVTFASGQSTINLTLTALADGIGEGTEIATIIGSYAICGTTATVNSINIAIKDPPTVSFGSISPSCGSSNGSVTVAPSGGKNPYSYIWSTSPPQNTQTATGLSAGTYSVTVTDANGCSVSSSYTLNTTPSLTMSVSSAPVSCNGGNNGTATASASSGVSPYTYQWNTTPAQNTQTATGLISGTYTVTAFDNSGCQNTANIFVGTPPAITLNTSSNAVTCAGGNDGTASVTASGGTSSYTYLWNNGATTSQATNLTAQTYSVTVTDNNNCTKTASVTVNDGPANADATISSAGPFCDYSSSAALTAASSGGVWSGTGITNSANGTFSPSVAGAGNFNIIYSINSSCGDTDTVSITVNATPDATINAVNPLCTDDSPVTLSAATAGGSFSGTGVSGNSFAPAVSGAGSFTITYDITVNGCSSSDTETITVNQSLDASITQAGPFCDSDAPLNLSAVSGGGIWSGNGITNSANGTFSPSAAGAGNFIIIYSINTVCGDTDTVSITVNATPDATINALNPLCTNDSPVTLSAATGGGSFSGTGVSGNSFAPAVSGAGSFTITYNVTVNGCSASDSEIITVNQSMDATITQVGPFCDSDAPLNLSAVSGGGVWSGTGITNSANGTFSPSVAGAGNFNIIYSINSSCGDTDTVSIAVSTVNLSLDNNTVNADCFSSCNGSASVTASNGISPYTYLWDDASASASDSVENLCAGTYQCVVTSTLGCKDSVQVTITQPLAISITPFAAYDATCFGYCDGYAITIPSGGTQPYFYNWSNGDSIATAGNLCAGIYSFTLTDGNGCIHDTSFSILEPSPVYITAAGVPTNCAGSCDGSATATGLGQFMPFTYQWDANANSQTDSIATGLCAGTYSVTATDSKGCQIDTSVNIPMPLPVTVGVSADTTICIGGSATVSINYVSGGAGSYTYLWNNNVSAPFQAVQPFADSCLSVVATDGNNCSSAPAAVCIFLYPALVVNVSEDDTICPGSSVALSASASGGDGAPYTYEWNNSGTGQSFPGSDITDSPSGTNPSVINYQVVAWDGCSPKDTDTVAVSFYPVPSPVINPAGSGCAPYTATLGSNNMPGVTDCMWDVNGTVINNCSPFTYTFSDAGTYMVNLTVYTAECVSAPATPVPVSVYPNPFAAFSYLPEAPTIINSLVNFTNASSGQITSWNWTFYNTGNGVLGNSNEINPSFTFPSDTGLHPVNLIVTTSDNCPDDTTLYIHIDNEYSLYIPNAFTPNGDGNNDFFPPKGLGINPEKFSLYIFDRWGDLIFESHNLNDPWDGSAREQGSNKIVKQDVYVWKIETEEASRNPKKHNYTGTVILLKGKVD